LAFSGHSQDAVSRIVKIRDLTASKDSGPLSETSTAVGPGADVSRATGEGAIVPGGAVRGAGNVGVTKISISATEPLTAAATGVI
jgi:hypothetical protein